MKKLKWLSILSVFEIIMGVILCVTYVFKLIDGEYRWQRISFIVGVVSLVLGMTALVLSKNPKYRREVILSEIDEREISIKHKSGYIAGWFLYFVSALFTWILYLVDLHNVASIPTWVMLWPLGMSVLYLILYLICFYFMRNKK